MDLTHASGNVPYPNTKLDLHFQDNLGIIIGILSYFSQLSLLIFHHSQRSNIPSLTQILQNSFRLCNQSLPNEYLTHRTSCCDLVDGCLGIFGHCFTTVDQKFSSNSLWVYDSSCSTCRVGASWTLRTFYLSLLFINTFLYISTTASTQGPR